jgi:hypothetical protein
MDPAMPTTWNRCRRWRRPNAGSTSTISSGVAAHSEEPERYMQVLRGFLTDLEIRAAAAL